MSLATLLRKMSADTGISIDPDEFESLGLSVDDADDESPEGDSFDLSAVLAGEASGAVEIFLSNPVSMLADGKAVEADGLMWEPIIREGQWAVRPGANGQKVKRPLRVIAGHSKNQRKEIGLADIVAAFDDGAVEHVTVPTSHDNLVTQNTGFIKGLKIIKAKVKDAKSKTEKTVSVLMGGYDIRKADIKTSLLDGSIASRSAGILYDYVNTETGKQYGVVLEHVALTNKPWITGMKAFGRKLVKPLKPAPVGLSLSDDEPSDQDLLAADDVLDGIELADGSSITWDKEDDPDWLRARVNCQLDEARAKKLAAVKARLPIGTLVYDSYDYPPRYRCVKARPGLALVADGWGDEANNWTAPFKVVDGDVELETDLAKWTASKRVYVPDDARKEFEEGEEPLSDQQQASEKIEPLTGMALAQANRRARANKTDGAAKVDPEQTPTHPRGGEHMADESNTLQLSDEAQRRISEAEKRAAAAEKRAEELDKKFSAMFSENSETKADKFVAHLKNIGLDETRGFAGALVEVRELMLADDGGEAVQDDKFSDDSNAEGTLTLSQAIQRIFKAIELGEDGKIKLGQSITPPPATKIDEPEGDAKLGDDGKPLPKVDDEDDFDSLSDDEQTARLAKDNPEMFAMLRLAVPSATNGNSKGGD